MHKYSEKFYQLLRKFRPAAGQIALLYNVPIAQLDEITKALKDEFNSDKYTTYNIRFRGPRTTANKQSTLKKDATAFSVYEVRRRVKYVPRVIAPAYQPPEYVMVNGYQYKLV